MLYTHELFQGLPMRRTKKQAFFSFAAFLVKKVDDSAEDGVMKLYHFTSKTNERPDTDIS